MKKLSLISVFILLSCYIFSQTAENPFKKLGYDVLVATSSRGEFEEFHDRKEVVEIGSVYFNTKTKEIVGFVDEEKSSTEISSTTIAMSIDPLCEQYYWISPYAYVMNNPINAIDPDGKKVIFTLPLKGGKTMNLTYNTSGQLINSGGQVLNITKGSHLDRVVTAYNKMLNSSDKGFSDQIKTLINSDKDHYVSGVQGADNSVSGGDKGSSVTEDSKNIAKGIGVGSKTRYNFSDEAKKEFKEKAGVGNSDFSTVTHEVQHAYDYDQGKMADSHSQKSSAKSPAEQRAVKNENKARKIEGLPMRTTYGGVEIDPKKLK